MLVCAGRATPSNAAARPSACRGEAIIDTRNRTDVNIVLQTDLARKTPASRKPNKTADRLADELSNDLPFPAPNRAQQLFWATSFLPLLLGAFGVLLSEWMWPPRSGAASGRRSNSGRLVRCRTVSCRGAWLILVALLPLACALSPPPSTPPPGSTCENAMPFDGAGAASFVIDIASTDAGPGPSRAYNSSQCRGTSFSPPFFGDVFWLRLTDVRTLPLELHTCAADTSFDTDLSVFTGSCDALTQVACNGDGQGLRGCPRFYSRITGLQLSEGERYWVVVGGYGGATGAVLLAAEYQIPPPSLPSLPLLPPLPPIAPGFVAAASEAELRSLIEEAVANISIYLPPSAHFKLGSQIRCIRNGLSNIKVTVASSGEGATLDGQEQTGLFYLEGGCSLTLRGLTLVNGRAGNGGGVVEARSAGDVEIIESTVRDCHAVSSGPGGVVLAFKSGAVSIIGSNVTGCSADLDGGVVWASTSGAVSISGSTVTSCSAVHEGGVVFARFSESLSIADVDFIDNSARSGSVVHLRTLDQRSSISDASFTGNTAGDDKTIQTNSEILWDCRLGSWMPSEGAFKGDVVVPECNPCFAGYYGNTSGLTDATCSGQCIRGHFCEAGTGHPEPCPTGRYSPVIGAPRKEFCIPCAPGQYQPLAGQSDCLTCPAGSFSPDVGLAACDPCPSGGYCDEAGAATRMVWEPCPAGSFNPTKGSNSSAACELCPAGTASATPGANNSETCSGCRAGTFANETGQSGCTNCPAGSFSNPGSHSCDECDVGYYAANPGQGLCIPCPHPLSSANGSTTCSFCKDGFYLLTSTADPNDIFHNPTEYCKPCPTNATCPDKTTLASLILPCGLWRASPSSAVLTECRVFGGNDSAGKTRCAGSDPVAREASRRRRMNEQPETAYCASGFKGPECQLCVAGNHYLDDGEKCKECAPRGAAAGRIVGLVLGLCVACGLAAYCYYMTEWREKRCIGRLLRLADRAIYWCVAVGLTAKTKILFGFFQVVTVLFTTYSTRLPPEYTGWTDAVADAVSIDWSGFFLPQQCLGYGLRLLAIALSPVALIALLILAGVCLRLHPWRAAPAPHARPWYAEAALGLLDLTPAGLVLVFCFVPSISASIFRAWSCQAYTISPPDEPLRQVSYMRQDASVECGTEDHESITDLASILIALWPVGSLVLFTALLFACHKPLQAKTPTALTRATAFLHREYKTTFYWWEAVELARKLVLTGFVLLIPEENALLRLVVATLICSCYVALVAATKPYKRVEDSVLAVAMSLLLLLLFLGANWTTIFLRIEERSGTDDAAAVFGFSKLNPIVSTMIILAGVALLISLAGAVVAARRTAKVPTIRLVSTKQPPELTLARGLAWHLFLSHIWSTGQDTVGVIKSELQLLLPGIKVFLDVDDLKDIGALEEYIRRTQMILFFLSQGYFRSPNCLREIRASLEQSKPLVLVQEADPAKGGATLQALRDECPDELQSDIFDQGRTQTTWYRIEEFQRVSLKTIVEAVLLCSPDYDGQDALGLYVPGEPRIHSFALAKPVTLWASPANAGALELANELAAAFAGLTVSTAEDPGSVASRASHRRSSIMRRSTPRRAGDATHMLLYLNEDTFVSDERLAEQVRQAREDRLPIVMAHENDPDKGGVPFSRFFETTPQELIAGGLYKDLAKSCYPGRHHEVSLVLVAKGLGATPARARVDLRRWKSLVCRAVGGLFERTVRGGGDDDDGGDVGHETSAGQQSV